MLRAMHEEGQQLSLTVGQSLSLVAHPAHLPYRVTSVHVRMLALNRDWLCLRWRIEGGTSVVIPPFAGRGTADGLWRTTCFELFMTSGEGEGYAEFNLSPSERWAAYDFTGYREGMAGRTMPRDPVCTLRGSGDVLLFEAAIPRGGLPPPPARMAISAVIEEADGVKSFWALTHAVAAPDFHDPRGFAALLGADGAG